MTPAQADEDLAALRQLTAAGLAVYDAYHRAQTYTAEMAQMLARAEDLMRLASLAYLPDEKRPLPPADTRGARQGMADAYIQAQRAYADLKDSLYRLVQGQTQAGAFTEALQALDALAAIEPGYRDISALRPLIAFRQSLATDLDAGRFERASKRWKEWRKGHPEAAEEMSIEDVIRDEIRQREEQARRRPDVVVNLASGVTMAFRPIPASEFQMGNDRKWVAVGEFQMGKYPVTVAQFTAFVQATRYSCDPSARRDLQKFGNHPVNNVSWNDAQAFCDWASQASGKGLRLPTEQEWEKAARGADGRTYPWGEAAPDGKRCNFNRMVGNTTPVGKYSTAGDSPYGCADMAGNVWEWTASNYDSSRYVLRGGSWDNDAELLGCAFRDGYLPGPRNSDYGFRCAC